MVYYCPLELCTAPVLCLELRNYPLDIVLKGQRRNLKHIDTHLQRDMGEQEIGKEVDGWTDKWMAE